MFNDVVRILEEHRDFAETGEPQEDSEIVRAERDLGIKFPQVFREYLSRWGYISFGPNEYFGLGEKYNNIVDRTRMARERANLPTLFVMICDRDGDEYVCIDTEGCAAPDCPIVIWDVASQVVSRKRSNGFEDFLKSDLEDFLE